MFVTKNNKLRKISILNLCAGYLMVFLLILLVMLNKSTMVEVEHKLIASGDGKEVVKEGLFNGVHEKEGVIYVNQHPTNLVKEYSVGTDRLSGVIAIDRERVFKPIVGIDKVDRVVIDDLNYEISRGNKFNRDALVGPTTHGGIHRYDRGSHAGDQIHLRDSVGGEDRGYLDRRLAELEKTPDIAVRDRVTLEDDSDFTGLTLANDDGLELGELNLDLSSDGVGKPAYGTGKGGQLYAYNFPSQGIGAGIGSSAVGAGAGGGAGLSAGIGEGVVNGEAVPTLGGVGSGPLPLEGQSAISPGSGGVGGLIGGAGAGGAAGLTQGYVIEKLGLGIGKGKGAGYGAGGAGRGHNYDHLPRDGALHIMMHVDGSGSILNTRKQLDIMKDTLLKDALLPYYNNDESLYNNRVSIIANSGERTLKFFSKAAERENVLALAFQDEAQPCYHLPNFNKKPEGDYLDDLKVLKSKLNSHDGIYRGIMFQVDRGKTFAKSFKEFVGNAFQGKGYLKNSNLRKYYWQENKRNIKDKSGIVFSDEYHANDEGDPQYYLDLIFEASKKIGLDLKSQGAGLTDGNYNPN